MPWGVPGGLMVSDTDAIDQPERIPRLVAGTNPLGVPRCPEESYLLSRVDGCTPWSALREIGGMPAERADALLESWLVGGVLTVKRACTGEGSADPPFRESGGPGGIDPALDLPTELQQRILALSMVNVNAKIIIYLMEINVKL